MVAAKLLPLQQAIAEFKVSQATLFRWLQDGRLKRYRQPGKGNVTWLDRAELRRLTAPMVLPAVARRAKPKSRRSRRGRGIRLPLKLRQGKGESDKAFAARVDAAREGADMLRRAVEPRPVPQRRRSS